MNLFSQLIDIIYPPRCPICRGFLRNDGATEKNTAGHMCGNCYSDLREIHPPLCPVCGRPFVTGIETNHLCEECLRKRPDYDSAAAAYLYEGALMTAIHRFKYGSKRFLSDSLGPLLAQFAESRLQKCDSLLAMPIPLHPRRLRERGFNQSLLLATYVAKRLDTELDFLSLRRVRYTLPQTGLGKEERRKNVKNAFQLKNPKIVKGRTVLLIDDVATTGNTLNECARILKRAGSGKVLCLVLARAGNL
jgi:ComF family protein